MCEPYGGWVGVGIRPPAPIAADMIPGVVRYISVALYSAYVLVGVVCLYLCGCLCVCFLSHGWGVFWYNPC